MAARKLRDASIVEYDINLSQVMPRTKQVPFKPIKFMSEIRHVIPDEPKPRRKPSQVDAGIEVIDPYEVNE